MSKELARLAVIIVKKQLVFFSLMNFFSLNDYQLPTLGCFLLFFSMMGYWLSLIFPTVKLLFTASRFLVLASNLLFATMLLVRWVSSGYFPLSNLYESLIFLSWGFSSVHLFVESKTKSRLLGSVSAPILFFLSGFSTLTLPVEMQKALPLVPSLQSNWLMMHVSMMMVSYSTLLIGSLLSIFYLALEVVSSSSIKQLSPFGQSQDSIDTSRFSLFQTVDIWSYRIIGLGFPFLTIGIISGAVWANEAWGSYWSWDPKETWALITWMTFATYLHSRLLKGWQGSKAAVLGAVGFFVIWICYLGVNFLGKGLHTYGWVLS